MRSDKDNDQKIDKHEAKELALKIRLQLQEYDVDFDSDKFIKVVAKDPSVPGVIAIVQKLLPAEETAEVKEESKDVDYATDSDEDTDDEDSEESEMYGKFGSIIRHLIEDYYNLRRRLLTMSFVPCRYVLHGG